MGIEDPDNDVAEQRSLVVEDEPYEEPVAEPDVLPTEADPADVAEQRAEVPEDDDWDR
jgi:hypothetical protein